jgi:hypothetical protein
VTGQSWRTCWTGSRELLRTIVWDDNPILPPIPKPQHQFPRDMSPLLPWQRNLLGKLLAERGVSLDAWLADPLQAVRDQLQQFIDSFPGFPIPLERSQRLRAIDELIRDAENPYKYTVLPGDM